MIDFFALLDGNSKKTTRKIVKAPFGRPGGKSKTIDFILNQLPTRTTFVDVFGGSGVILLNRPLSKNEVFNDINSGIVSVYRCLRDPVKLAKLTDWIDNTIHSYEDWVTCKETWQDTADDVERAGRWLYLVTYSFAYQGRAYGFTRGNNNFSGKLVNKIPVFSHVHARFKNVNVENLDWKNLMDKYDSKDTVFYLDPPYPDSDMKACYGKDHMSWDKHREMIEYIRQVKGFVALSGYQNQLYDSQDFWTGRVAENTNKSVGSKQGGDQTYEEVVWLKA